MNIESLYRLFLQHPSIQTDTRKLKKGDFYFALKGENFDGNQFAAKALEMGAAYAVIGNNNYSVGNQTILVEDVLKTLQELAHHHRKQFDIPFIAITGSNGKTTTKELIHAVLSSQYKTSATEGNLNNHIGVPLTLLKIKRDTEIAIIEMGANHQREIESYCKIAEPTHALITNCGKAHLEGFGSLEGVRKAKGELYDFIRDTKGLIFRNADLDYLQQMSEGISSQFTYGSSGADLIGRVYENNPYLQVAVLNSGKECVIKSNLAGAYNFPNVLAAVGIGLFFKIPIDKIKTAVENYSPGNSRSQIIQNQGQTIIMDAYNANPSSMQAAISNFAHTDYPNKTVMLGAMMELGKDSVAEHQNLIQLLQQSNWNHVVLVGGDFKFTKHDYQYFDEVSAAAEWYRKKQFQNMAILIKGSRAIGMEKVIEVSGLAG